MIKQKLKQNKLNIYKIATLNVGKWSKNKKKHQALTTQLFRWTRSTLTIEQKAELIEIMSKAGIVLMPEDFEVLETKFKLK